MSKNDLLERQNTFHKNINPFYELLVRHIFLVNGINLTGKKNEEKKISLASQILENDKEYTKSIIKHLMKYPFAQEIGARYNFKKEYIKNRSKHYDFFFPKIITFNNDYYMYNNYLPKDNQKLLKITKINDVDIKEIIKSLKEDGYIPVEIIKLIQQKEVLDIYGFDGTKYKVTLEDDDKTYEFDMNESDLKIDYNIFYKRHKMSKLLNKDNFNLDNNNYNENVSYSYDSNLRILKLLHGLFKNDNDRNEIKNIYDKNIKLFGRGSNNDKNIDWMFITSFFLFNREEENKLLDFQYSGLESMISGLSKYNIQLLDKNNNPISITDKNDINKYIITDDNIDVKKVFHAVRNSFAHSSYEIYDENYVRIYGYDQNGINNNFLIHIDVVKKFINYLSRNTTLGDNFPILSIKLNKINKPILNRDELIKHLNESQIIEIDHIKLLSYDEIISNKRNEDSTVGYFKNLDRLDHDNAVKYLNDDFNDTLNILKSEISIQMIRDKTKINSLIRSRLASFMDYRLITRKFRQEEIDKILMEVDKNSDKFYEHSILNQYKVLTEISRNVVNPNRNITSIINELIKTKSKAEGSIIDTLDERSVDYIQYDKIIKASIIAYLNNILLYNFNNSVDVSNLDFSALKIEFNLDDMISKRELRLNQLKSENKNILEEEKRLNKNIEGLKKSIEKCPEHIKAKLIKDKESKELLLKSIDKTKYDLNEIEIQNLNLEIENIKNKFLPNEFIYEHLRNSLAHGNIRFIDTIDYNDICNMNLRFVDYFPDTKEISFQGQIKLSELLIVLNDDILLNSIFNKKEQKTEQDEKVLK